MISGAVISPCLKYRYHLWRVWDDCAPMMIFCMMNPSTADATHDDNTIRRCIGYAKRERHGGISVVNVFAYRSAHPRDLLAVGDPVGPDNNEWLRKIRGNFTLSTLVAAWGNPKGGKRFSRRYLEARHSMTAQHAKCLGINKDGSPKHPLYVEADAPLIAWEPGLVFCDQPDMTKTLRGGEDQCN